VDYAGTVFEIDGWTIVAVVLAVVAVVVFLIKLLMAH
jgi:hypothetical protein